MATDLFFESCQGTDLGRKTPCSGPKGHPHGGKYRENILARWSSEHNNGRIEALNGIFQAAKAKARGYRNVETFISIIYLLAAPIQELIKFHTK